MWMPGITAATGTKCLMRSPPYAEPGAVSSSPDAPMREAFTLEDVAVPGEFEDMFAPIPESKFRYDVSSTELRAAALEQG